jgi:leader peptidase (prepilin peptidase) / N-methyltransferase
MGAPPLLQSVMLTLLGLIAGSFLSVLVIRLPDREPVAWARSKCLTCSHTLGVRDLIPIASWLICRGTCRFCGERISLFYPAIEISAVILALWASVLTQGTTLALSCILGWLLLALAAMDIRTYRLNDVLTLSLALLGLLTAAIFDRENLMDHFAGVAAGFGLLFGVNWLYGKLRGHDGMGLGDAKLLGAGGAWIAWQGLPSVLCIGTFTALLVAASSALLGRKLNAASMLPFGPFLAIGIWIVWLYGPLALWQE